MFEGEPDALTEARKRADDLLIPGYRPLRARLIRRFVAGAVARYELNSRPLRYTVLLRGGSDSTLAELECLVTSNRMLTDNLPLLRLTVGDHGDVTTIDEALDAVVRAVADRAPVPSWDRATFVPGGADEAPA